MSQFKKNILRSAIILSAIHPLTGMLGCIEVIVDGPANGTQFDPGGVGIGGIEPAPFALPGQAFLRNEGLENDDLPLPISVDSLYAKMSGFEDIKDFADLSVRHHDVSIKLIDDQGELTFKGSVEKISGDIIGTPPPDSTVGIKHVGDCEVKKPLDNVTLNELRNEISSLRLCKTPKPNLNIGCSMIGYGPDFKLPLELYGENQEVQVTSSICENASFPESYGLCEDAPILESKIKALSEELYQACLNQVVP